MGRKSMFELDPTAQERFLGAITALEVESKISVNRAVKKGVVAWVRKAVNATPISPKSSGWYTLRHAAPDVGLGVGDVVQLPHPEVRNNTLAKVHIWGRGFAKSGFAEAADKLGAGIKGLHKIPGGDHGKVGNFASNLGRDTASPFAIVSNTVPYIETLDRGGVLPRLPNMSPRSQRTVAPKHISNKAFVRATHQIEKELTRAARKFASKWSGA